MSFTTPEDVQAQIEATLTSDKYNRLLAGRFFQATIKSFVSRAPAPGYNCTVALIGETKSGGSLLVASLPGYVPTLGQVVFCEWYDANTAIILWPVY